MQTSDTHPSAQQTPSAPPVDNVARVERVLAEYLRSWGLRDPAVIAQCCRRWSTESCQASSREATQEESPADLTSRAMRIAQREIDQWIDELSHRALADDSDAQAARGMLAMRLQAVIDDHSASWLNHGNLPIGLTESLEAAAQRVVPDVCLARMLPQPLGELASPLKWSWWRRTI
ncbi:MAG TPA: hypothetical protein VG433_11170, partial [Pirellulales bacterium]|nr:hypothetical protein [Pirellulales bacterium]